MIHFNHLYLNQGEEVHFLGHKKISRAMGKDAGERSQAYNRPLVDEWMGEKWSESESRPVVSDSLRPRGLNHPRNSPGQNTGVDSCSFLQGVFPAQGSNTVSCTAGRFFPSWATREAQYWSGQPTPSLADLPDPGIELGSPALQADSLPADLRVDGWTVSKSDSKPRRRPGL